jgi:hypothetical protein
MFVENSTGAGLGKLLPTSGTGSSTFTLVGIEEFFEMTQIAPLSPYLIVHYRPG